jgi:hypothetical protein
MQFGDGYSCDTEQQARNRKGMLLEAVTAQDERQVK